MTARFPFDSQAMLAASRHIQVRGPARHVGLPGCRDKFKALDDLQLDNIIMRLCRLGWG